MQQMVSILFKSRCRICETIVRINVSCHFLSLKSYFLKNKNRKMYISSNDNHYIMNNLLLLYGIMESIKCSLIMSILKCNIITSTSFLESDYIIQITCNQLLPAMQTKIAIEKQKVTSSTPLMHFLNSAKTKDTNSRGVFSLSIFYCCHFIDTGAVHV